MSAFVAGCIKSEQTSVGSLLQPVKASDKSSRCSHLKPSIHIQNHTIRNSLQRKQLMKDIILHAQDLEARPCMRLNDFVRFTNKLMSYKIDGVLLWGRLQYVAERHAHRRRKA